MPEQPLQPREVNRWLGMHHDKNAKTPPGTPLFLQNVYTRDGRLVGRSGTVQLGAQLAAAKIQGIYFFEELDGTSHILAFCNGDMFEYDSGTDSWTQTDLSAQGITLDPSSTLSFANSRGRLIVTDGVNTPFMWDGSSFTTLTNAPIAGAVTIYYDKVFFYDVKNQKNSFEWSNEGDPLNGYDATGQSWEFAQTDAGAVKALAALNNTLVVLKEDSGTHVLGSVGDNFRTAAVREGLSETEGTISTHGVLVVDGDVYFLSQNGPRLAEQGQRLLKINENQNGDDRLRDTWDTVSRSTWDNALAVHDPNLRHVWFLLPDDDLVIVYAVDEDAWATFDFPWTITAVGQVEETDGDEFVLIGDNNGNVYQYGDNTLQSDSGAAIERIIRSRQHGLSSTSLVKRLVEARLYFDLSTDITLELKPMSDGDVGTSAAVTIDVATEGTGRHTYRKAFNEVGIAVGWELYQNQIDESLELEGALTLITRVGSYAGVQ